MAKVRFGSIIRVQDDSGVPIKHWLTAVVTNKDDARDLGTMRVVYKDEPWKVYNINIKKLRYKVIKY